MALLDSSCSVLFRPRKMLESVPSRSPSSPSIPRRKRGSRREATEREEKEKKKERKLKWQRRPWSQRKKTLL